MIELQTEEPQKNKTHTWRLYWFHETDPDASYPANADTLAKVGFVEQQRERGERLVSDYNGLLETLQAETAKREHLEAGAERCRNALFNPHLTDDKRLDEVREAFPGPPKCGVSFEASVAFLGEALCEDNPGIRMECDSRAPEVEQAAVAAKGFRVGSYVKLAHQLDSARWKIKATRTSPNGVYREYNLGSTWWPESSLVPCAPPEPPSSPAHPGGHGPTEALRAELVAAIRKVCEGKGYMSHRIWSEIADELARGGK